MINPAKKRRQTLTGLPPFESNDYPIEKNASSPG